MNLFNKISEFTLLKKMRMTALAVIEVLGAGGAVAGTISGAELVRVCDDATRVVNATGALALTQAGHSKRYVTLNAAAGQALTLPAATGSGADFELFVGTTITSNSTTIKTANANDFMFGNAFVISDDAGNPVKGFMTANSGVAATESDTITLNGSTTGGLKGDVIMLKDVAANTWQVRIFARATGVEATMFSATV